MTESIWDVVTCDLHGVKRVSVSPNTRRGPPEEMSDTVPAIIDHPKPERNERADEGGFCSSHSGMIDDRTRRSHLGHRGATSVTIRPFVAHLDASSHLTSKYRPETAHRRSQCDVCDRNCTPSMRHPLCRKIIRVFICRGSSFQLRRCACEPEHPP